MLLLQLRKFCVNVVQDLSKEIVVIYDYYDPNARVNSNDKKYLYSLQVLTLTLLWHSFDDAVCEWQSSINVSEIFCCCFSSHKTY